MNFDRSTEGESPLRWLNVIQRGGTDDWRRLYGRCRERQFAGQIVTLLRRPDPDSLPACRLWLRLLEDVHPGLTRPGEPSATDNSLAGSTESPYFREDQPVGSSPAVVDGKVLVGSEDGSLYCFGPKTEAKK
jgi:hypothetical protein